MSAFTKEKPTVAGFYFWKPFKDAEVSGVDIKISPNLGELAGYITGTSQIFCPENMEGEFCGPISPDDLDWKERAEPAEEREAILCGCLKHWKEWWETTRSFSNGQKGAIYQDTVRALSAQPARQFVPKDQVNKLIQELHEAMELPDEVNSTFKSRAHLILFLFQSKYPTK